MKKCILLFCLMSFICIDSKAQLNKGIHFQGVARNNNGLIIANKIINLRLSILTDSSNGNIEYQEIKSVTTNAIGLFSVVVGGKEDRKINSIGNFENINWSNTEKYLQVDIDMNGDLYFTNIGCQKINYVPYAFYADKVDAVNINGILPVKKGGIGFDNIKDFKTMAALDKINNTPDSLKPTSIYTLITLNEKLKKTDTIWMNNRIESKLNKTDTNFLSTRIDMKLNKSDTNYLSNRINQKFNLSDTIKIYNKINAIPSIDTTSLNQKISLKLNKTDTNFLSTRIDMKLNKSDTNYLSNRINQKINISDTLKIYNKINAIPSIDTTSLSQRINLKLNKTDTSYFSSRIDFKLNKTDTNFLSTRIDMKLNKSDTNYLSNRINQKFNLSDTIKIYNKINAIPNLDTTSLSNRINQKISLADITKNSVTSALNYTPVPNDYGSFYDTAKQVATIATAIPLKFNFINFANNIAITNNSSGLPTRITTNYAGIYNIKYALQFIKTDASNDEVSVWIRRNSAAYANTNNTYTILGAGIKNAVSNSFFVELGDNDYVEIYFSVKNSSTSLAGSNVQASPSRPATPAAMVLVQRIN